jgi:hypothetical protein
MPKRKKHIEFVCPVCDDFLFTYNEGDEEPLEDQWCYICGWHYDPSGK